MKGLRMIYDVIIVGSGISGLTAAIYTSRARLKTVVAAGSIWGGQLMFTTVIENFPGFKNGILGAELMNNIRQQAERFGSEIIFQDVTRVDFSHQPFNVVIGANIFEGKTVIIATGASPKWLGVKNERQLRGRGVSSCATCDAAFFKDKKVVVVGGGDSAMEEALTLAKFASEVKIVHRRDKLRASKILQERILDNPKIEIVWNHIVQEISGATRVEGVKLIDVDSSKVMELQCDGVFIAIGHKPNTELFKDQIELDERGYVVAQDAKTSVEGIFVAGDMQDYQYRQAITAAGSGCKAALSAQRYLEKM